MQRHRLSMVAKVAATESVATVRSALWPLAHLHRLPHPPRGPKPPVVLVHGYLGHPAMWRPLIRRLYLDGWGAVHTVRYASTRRRMPEIVRAIAEVVDPLGDGVQLIGHSLGAVASRAFLKTGGGAGRVARFVSLGGPHAGTAMYRLAPRNLWEILDPDGPWVRRLVEGDEPVPTVVRRALRPPGATAGSGQPARGAGGGARGLRAQRPAVGTGGARRGARGPQRSSVGPFFGKADLARLSASRPIATR